MSATFFRFSGRLVIEVLMLAGMAGCFPAVAQAQPRVAIDVGTTVSCRDVTPADFAASHPDEKIVEARFNLSVLVEAGSEQDLEQLQVVIASPQRRLRVVDFQPRTELASEMAGDVEVANTNDTIQSLNASLGGVVSGSNGPVHVQASPAAGVGITQNKGSKEIYHRLAPKQLVLSSGTMNAEHGVFFKWRRSSQVTLEGWREVTCRFLVPHDWRADWMQLSAACVGRHRNYFGDKLELCGQANVFIGLALDGDAEAHQAARALSSVQVPADMIQYAAGDSAGRRHTAYKPTGAEPGAASEWFTLPPLLKLCDHEQPKKAAARKAAARAAEMPFTLHDLERLSGTQPGGELKSR